MSNLSNKLISTFSDISTVFVISSTLNQQYWNEYIKKQGFKSIAGFIKTLAVSGNVTIFNYENISDHFNAKGMPTNFEILSIALKLKRPLKISLDLTNPLQGMKVWVGKSKGLLENIKIVPYLNTDTFILRGSYSNFTIESKSKSGRIVLLAPTQVVSVLNDFAFEINAGKFKFNITYLDQSDIEISLNDDLDMGKEKNFKWVGLRVENDNPRAFLSRNPYFKIAGLVYSCNFTSDFIRPLMAIAERMTKYCKDLNMDNTRINQALKHNGMAYTSSEIMARNLRTILKTHGLDQSHDSEITFIPYIEMHGKGFQMRFGIINR